MRTTRRMLGLILAVLCALLLCAGSAAGRPRPQADELRVLLPSVQQLAQSPGSTLTTLSHEDCGFVAAVVVPNSNRVLLGYIIRPNGNLLHIAEDVGDHLIEVKDPVLARLFLAAAAQSPGFVFPGPKQGTAFLIITGSTLHIYATSREEGDETGPFKLMRLDMPVPAPPQ